jgi:putative transposon-encoded protein
VAIKAQLEELSASDAADANDKKQVKFEIYGEELIEKKVKASGNSGRVYLPPNWIGHNVKIVRID